MRLAPTYFKSEDAFKELPLMLPVCSIHHEAESLCFNQCQRQIGPVMITALDREEAISQIVRAIQLKAGGIFAFCNMHTFNIAKASPAMAGALKKATVFNDGLGIDIAGRILLREKFPANLNGTDLTPALLSLMPQPAKLFLLGGGPGVAEMAASALEARYPHISVVGCQHGFFSPEDSPVIADRIREMAADLLLIGMGQPLQELWAAEFAGRTRAVVLCVGAFLDFAAGRIQRAPWLIRRARCEWLFRFALEPRRLFGRYVGGGPIFLWAIILHRLQRPHVGVRAPRKAIDKSRSTG